MIKDDWWRNMIKDREENLGDSKELEPKPIEKVADLKCKKIGNMTRKMRMLEREVTTLRVANIVTLGIVIMVKWMKDICSKYGEEGYQAFECTNFGKKGGGSSMNFFSCE